MNYSIHKSILLASIILTSLTAFSQISITSANMPSAGDTIRYSSVQTPAGVDFKTTGVSKAWNFTNLKSTSNFKYSITKGPLLLSFQFNIHLLNLYIS